MLALRIALALTGLLVATPAAAKPVDCSASIAMVASAVAMSCDCAASATHGAFVRCAGGVVKGLVADGSLPRNCKGAMVRGFAKSTCGKPATFTTCCVPRGSTVACKVKMGATCERRGGVPGATPMCLDACTTGSPSGAFLD